MSKESTPTVNRTRTKVVSEVHFNPPFALQLRTGAVSFLTTSVPQGTRTPQEKMWVDLDSRVLSVKVHGSGTYHIPFEHVKYYKAAGGSPKNEDLDS